MTSSLTARALGALFLNAASFGMVALAGVLLLGDLLENRFRWIVGAVTVAVAGYIVFWCGFWHPRAGHVAAWSILAAAAIVVGRRRDAAKAALRLATPVALGTTLFVVAATALMLLYPRSSISLTAADRWFSWMPLDNTLPRVFAEIIDSGNPTRVLGGDWLTSDRPPLQTGIALLAWPLLSLFGYHLDTASAAAGIWYQALWFPVVWLLLQTLGLRSRAALGVTAALGATGFLVFSTVYVWPKLSGAAFVVAAFLLWFFPSSATTASSRRRLTLGAACAGCAWLSHGGVMFSLLALTPLIAFDALRRRAWREWAWAAAVFVLLATPWLLYQRYYSPPGNRLVKWHIAGAVAPDPRTVTQALRDQYRTVGWHGAWEARVQNFKMLFAGNWNEPFDPRADPASRRPNDFFYPLRAAAAWTLGLAALPWLLLQRSRALREHARAHLICASWLLGGLVVWLALMFSPGQLFTHQGTFVTQLLLLALIAAWSWLASRIFFAIVMAVQWLGFFATWIGPSSSPPVLPDRLAAFVAVVAGVALVALGAWAMASEEKTPNA